jgi:hypothetical protein
LELLVGDNTNKGESSIQDVQLRHGGLVVDAASTQSYKNTNNGTERWKNYYQQRKNKEATMQTT